MTTALFTDRYELTMVEAALRSGRASCPAVFEVFTRALPDRRPWGVFAGLGRLLDALSEFRFGPAELEWLEQSAVVGEETLEWLGAYHFPGRIDSYREGELYTAGSPVLTIEATFAEAVLLETLVLSILNFDSAVASVASLIALAAGERPVIEMGSRRVNPGSAVAAARAAYLAGFASTSNLEAGRRYGLPTAGTSSHAFVLAFGPDGEKEAFSAQVSAFGAGTTLLVDTYDVADGIRHAVEVAGPQLGAVRIDSGDLGREAARARALLDDLGATGTKLVVTGDLDAHTIAAVGGRPGRRLRGRRQRRHRDGGADCRFRLQAGGYRGPSGPRRRPLAGGGETVGREKVLRRAEVGVARPAGRRLRPDRGGGARRHRRRRVGGHRHHRSRQSPPGSAAAPGDRRRGRQARAAAIA